MEGISLRELISRNFAICIDNADYEASLILKDIRNHPG